MRNIKKFVLLIAVMLLSHIGGWAQKTAQDYQYAFDGQVKWMMLSDTGVLIASTGEALVGIKPNQKELHFKFERVKKVKEEDLEPIPNTPYVIIKPRGLFNHTVVIDIVKGTIVFDSKASDWQGGVGSRHLIYPDMLIVTGSHKEEVGQYRYGVGIYDLKTGNLVNIIERKASNTMVGVPDINKNTIIIPGLKNVTAYDIKSGSVKWSADVKNATRISANYETNEIYAFRTKGGNTVVYKINGNSGNLVWADGNKLKGSLSRYEFTKGGLVVVTNVDNSGKSKLMKLASGGSESKVYLLDTNTGADLWEKSPKTKGYIDHLYVEDDGILFSVASGGINKISFNGKALWKKPLKTGANIQILARVDKGVLYISGSDADIIDMNTGESVFGKAIKYKRSASVVSAYDEKLDRFLLSCKDGLYEIDGNNGEYNLLNGKLNFEGKEVAQEIDVRDNSILLTSDQNLTWLNFDGTEKKHVYHRAPGKSAVGAILMGALTLASATAMTAHSARAGYAKGIGVPSYHESVRQDERAADAYGAIADASFQELMKRFSATKATENASFILTKVDGGVALVKVDKDSGETLNEIVIEDKDPMYEVDDIEGFLYFKDKSNNISAYNLNK